MRDASRDQARLAADLVDNGPQRDRLLAILEEYPEIDCTEIKEEGG